MVSLHKLGIDEYGRGRETVSIFVGPNGSGKSSLLLEIADRYRFGRSVTIICNTPHDRFVGLRRVKRISVGRRDQSPKVIVKNAVAEALDTGSEFFQISGILKHCGYRPRFGFRIDASARYGISYDDLRDAEEYEVPDELQARGPGVPADDENLHRALAFLQRHDPHEPIWIDATGSVLEFSLAREFSSVLRRESKLRAWRIIKGISVYLERDQDRIEIEMHHASSGQLALISSLLYLITNVGEFPLILIDEPENSLHPNWQREYVEKVLAATTYRSATVLIATHAPLVVTGALSDSPDLVSVLEVRNGIARRLELDSAQSPNSIEEILWRAFDVVTPANHFVSEEIVAAIARFEAREIEKREVLHLIDRLNQESFDAKQKRFFEAVKTLVDKVEAARDTGADYDDQVGGGAGARDDG
ncbi:AAA family ATPase [Agrobacterium fabrum]|uniref:AAA family ATPase n=1 Tax=Agrobacterium fabrum TaxID=1176649 RepID=UPI003BA0CF94